MKNIICCVVMLLISTIISTNLFAQGCSDAGFCTIHSIKNNTEANAGIDKNNNEVVVGFSYGIGERSISYYTPYVEYTRSLGEKTSATAKFIYSLISGELANSSGPGDLFISVNHAYGTKSKWQKSFVVGFKIPFDKADIIKKGIHLPLAYQPSLGTTDLVLGVNFMRSSWGLTAAFQQPLNSTNDNHFLPQDYPSNTLTGKYLPTNQFSRKGDVLLRTSYNIVPGGKFTIRPSLLGIYHLGNDSYEDGNKVRKTIPDSDGLTLNANIFIDYKLTGTSGLELSMGAPFVTRANRPDGLTRSFVGSLEYKFSF